MGDQHDVVELTAERAVELVHKKLRFSRVCRPDNQNVEGDVAGVHAAISVSSEFDGFQLAPLDVHLGVADCEDVVVHVSGTAPGSLDLQLHPVFGVDEAGPATVQVLIDHRPQVNQNAELVVRVKLGRIQVARDVLLFGGLSQEKAAGLFPKIVGKDPVVVQHVGRAVDHDSYLCQVGVEIFFRISGAGCVRLNEEEKDDFQ